MDNTIHTPNRAISCILEKCSSFYLSSLESVFQYCKSSNPKLKPGTIPPKLHDLYNKDIDMRKLERQLRVLPDLLNSCPDIASKLTRVRTLATCLPLHHWLPACLVR